MTEENKERLIVLFKWLIVIGLGLVVYYHLYKQDNWTEIVEIFVSKLNADQWPLLLVAVGLMPINWILETIKWKKLVASFEIISYRVAIKSILLGIVLAMVTPARIGEYAGRLSLLSNKTQSIGATMLGSIAQNLITLVIGLLAFQLFMDEYLNVSIDSKGLLFIIVIVVIIVLSGFYFNLDYLLRQLSKLSFLKTIIEKLPSFIQYKNSLLIEVLGYSLIRYIVYLGQYYVLLVFFGIEAEPIVLISGIAILFLIQSGVPLPPMLSVIARGELAILIWSNVSDNSIAALAVSFSLWIINLILPSLFGLGILYNAKWKNTKI